MNYSRIRKHITEQSKPTLQNYAYLGEVLKRIRKEKDLTQEAVTKGICSVSYYSKVENNKMKPQPYFISEIGARLKTDLFSHFPGAVDKGIVGRLTESLFTHDSESISEIEKNGAAVEKTVLGDIAWLISAVINGQHARSNRLIRQIEPLLNTMDLSASQVFIVAAAMAQYDQHQYKSTLELLRITENTADMPEKLRALEQHYLFLAKQRLRFTLGGVDHYYNAREIWRASNHLERLTELELYRLYFMVEESPVLARQAIERLHERMIPPQFHNFHIYVQAVAAAALGRHEDTEAYLRRAQTDRKDAWYYRIKLMRHRLMTAHAPHETNTFHKTFFSEDATQYALEEKVRYTVETMHDAGALRAYVRDIAFPLAIERQNIPDMKMYAEKLMVLSIDASRYKEALAVKQKYDRALERIRNIELE